MRINMIELFKEKRRGRDVLFFEYAGTEFEMFVVLFPESTKECRVVRQEAYENLCKNELPQTLRNY